MPKKTTSTIFADDELAVLHSSANRVWEMIGGDYLQALAEDHGSDVNKVMMPRDHVVEVVVDADRLKEELRRDFMRLSKMDSARSRAAADAIARVQLKMGGISYAELSAAVAAGFPYDHYGM